MNANQLYHVPFLPSEWNTVKNAFENRNGANCFEALQVLSAWRLRSTSALPFTVQASEILIQAVLNDPALLGEAVQQNFLESENVRLIYGMAITRFVNYVTERDRQGGKGTAIATICKRVGIPHWVVDVRHAATHGHLPSLTSLREAIDFCWRWLQSHYWNRGLLRESDPEAKTGQTPKLKLKRPKLPKREASTSAASGCWALADENVKWAELPIGLGPGQQLEDLDFSIKAKDERELDDDPSEDKDDAVQSGSIAAEAQESVSQSSTNPTPSVEWDDKQRLELINSLISFVGE